jgi:hypothetical protein
MSEFYASSNALALIPRARDSDVDEITPEKLDYLTSIPLEIILNILVWVEDVDLQQVRKSCKTLSILACDEVLWNYIFMQRNSNRIKHLLNRPQRRTQRELARLAILPFPSNFITAENVRQHEARKRLHKLFLSQRIREHVSNRPSFQQLRQQNIIPAEMTIPTTPSFKQRVCSPTLVRKVIELKVQFRNDALKRRIEGRNGLDALREESIIKKHPLLRKSPNPHLPHLRAQVEASHVVKSRILTDPKDVDMDELERRLFEKLVVQQLSPTMKKPPSPLIEQRCAIFEREMRRFAPVPPPLPNSHSGFAQK